jgi:hypothetical protein
MGSIRPSFSLNFCTFISCNLTSNLFFFIEYTHIAIHQAILMHTYIFGHFKNLSISSKKINHHHNSIYSSSISQFTNNLVIHLQLAKDFILDISQDLNFGHFKNSLSNSIKFIQYLGFHMQIIPISSIHPSMQCMVRPSLVKISYRANNLQNT